MAKEAPETKPEVQKGGGKKKLIIIGGAALVLLAGGGVGAAYFLHLPPFARAEPAERAEAAPSPPVLIDLPDIVTNLNSTGRRQVFVRLRTKAETRQADVAAVQAAMPRLVDVFTAFLRETRPEELRGSAGTQRLREELLARANIAIHPGAVSNVLFVEMTVQ